MSIVLTVLVIASVLFLGFFLHGDKFNNLKEEVTASFASGPVPGTEKRFPAEWEEHERCYMQWPAAEVIPKEHLEGLKKDVAKIALAIAEYEPVTLLVPPTEVETVKKMFGSKSKVKSKIHIRRMSTDGFCARDTFPTFLKIGSYLLAVDFNFNGYGNKRTHGNDSLIASKVIKYLRIEDILSSLVSEGGALETDGEGTLLITASSIVNNNRNPNKTRRQIGAALQNMLGIEKVIWFEGVKGGEVTDAHVSSFVRFTSPGNVVISRPAASNPEPDVWSTSSDNAMEILRTETDAKGRNFTIVELPAPDRTKITGKENAFLSYASYYAANGAVVIPKYNDKEADDKAVEILGTLYPGRKMVQVEIDTLSLHNGGIHCATHELPRKSRPLRH